MNTMNSIKEQRSKIEILSHTDRTSWPRIGMILNYYLTVRRKWILFAIFPLVSAAIYLLFYFNTDQNSLFSAGKKTLELLVYFVALAPLLFAKPNAREITLSLPALGLEKIIAIFILCLIICPACILLPAEILSWCLSGFEHGVVTNLFTDATDLDGMELIVDPGWIKAYSLGLNFALLLTVMWGVFSSRRSTVGRAIWGFLGVFFGSVILISIIVTFMAMSLDITEENLDMDKFLKSVLGIYKYMAIICYAFIIFVVWRLCYGVARKQI